MELCFKKRLNDNLKNKTIRIRIYFGSGKGKTKLVNSFLSGMIYMKIKC